MAVIILLSALGFTGAKAQQPDYEKFAREFYNDFANGKLDKIANQHLNSIKVLSAKDNESAEVKNYISQSKIAFSKRLKQVHQSSEELGLKWKELVIEEVDLSHGMKYNFDRVYFSIYLRNKNVNKSYELKMSRIVHNGNDIEFLYSQLALYELNDSGFWIKEKESRDPFYRELPSVLQNFLYNHRAGQFDSEVNLIVEEKKTQIPSLKWNSKKAVELLEPKDAPGPVYSWPEVMPEFPGGKEVLAAWLRENVKAPTDKVASKMKGEMVAELVVNKDGTIDPLNVRMVKSINFEWDLQMKQAIQRMPLWKPAQQNGTRVRSRVSISFETEE